MVDADVGRDPREPGADLEASVEVQGLERPEKGLLRRFLRVVEVAEHPAADAGHPRMVSLIEVIEGLVLARLKGEHELPVRE